jgi:arylsulfatase A-like enzyme
VTAALVAASALGLLAAGCADEAPRPHVVLITADALRADHLSVNGYPRRTSPNLDAFAQASWHFSDAIAVIPKTGPAFATLFTGRHPREHGVRANFRSLPTGLPVLAERLGALGYRCAAFVSNPVLRESMGFARGFDFYALTAAPDGVRNANRAFLRWARAPWDRPTFVWLHYIDPHGPYTPPPDLEATFLGDGKGGPDRRVPLDAAPRAGGTPNKVLGAVPLYQRRGGEDRLSVYVARYDAEIRRVDAAFGEVAAFLRERGLYDESLVIFTSDHGESLGEHELYFEHGWFAYEPGLRVPLMIKLPKQAEGRVVPDLVSHLDLLPTLLARLGSPPPADAPGIDLFGPSPRPRLLVIENSDRYPEKYLGARTFRWKYLRRESDGAEELYDLRADPGETRNLEAQAPERLAGLREGLDAALRTLSDSALEPPEETPVDDVEALEQLEALGYLR